MQTIAQSGDCKSALKVHLDSSYQKSFSDIAGYGEILEIQNNELGNRHFFTDEHNTAWFHITCGNRGKLTFDISPQQLNDDWDFLLFKSTDGGCKEIASKKIIPVRSNLARNDVKLNSKTGLSLESSEELVAAGPNVNYSKALEVDSNQNYILVIDNNKKAGHGFNLSLLLHPEKKEIKKSVQVVEKKSNIIKEISWLKESNVPQSKYSIKLLDQETKKPLNGDIKIVIELGYGNDSIIEYKNKSDVMVSVDAKKNFSVSVRKEGYMFFSSNYRSEKKDTSISLSVSIPKAKVGQVISLPDINFRENTTHLLPNSIHALNEIYDFLHNNPNTKIEIRGHVNAPGYENTGKVRKFSEKRADEVKEFLIGMGIESNRIKTVGLGNAEMIYPSPSDYEQEKANRRVEIKILEE